MSLALDMARVRATAGEDTFRGEYLRALRMIERLHRLRELRVTSPRQHRC